MQANTQRTANPEARIRITYWMTIAFIFLFCVMGWTVLSSENYSVPSIEPVVIHVFLVVGFLSLGLSFPVRSRMIGPKQTSMSGSFLSSHTTPSMDAIGFSEPNIDTVVLRKFHRAHLIVVFLCTSTSMYGLMITLFTGTPVTQFVMSGFAILALIFHWPRRGDLLTMERTHDTLQRLR